MGEPESIMLAPYPTGVEAWRDPQAEVRMAAVKDTIHAARSLRAQYGLTPAARPSFVVRVAGEELRSALAPQEDDFRTLVKAERVAVVVGGEAPEASAVTIVNDQTQVYMELRGMVDAAAEIRKLEKQLGQVDTRVTSLAKQMAIPGYEAKVPEAVRQGNAAKAEQLATERDNVLKAIESFKGLLISS
jgi:valyl-tRNA synthetase